MPGSTPLNKREQLTGLMSVLLAILAPHLQYECLKYECLDVFAGIIPGNAADGNKEPTSLSTSRQTARS